MARWCSSTQTTDENSKQNDAGGANGQTSASANVPGTPGATPGAASGSTSANNVETTNYEISKTTKTTVQEPGTIKRLSVAVAVDGATAVDAKGNPGAYTARSAEEMKHIEDLVRSAVGFDATRGDQISVVNVRFEHDPATTLGTAAGSKMFDFDKSDIMRGGQRTAGELHRRGADHLLRGPPVAEHSVRRRRLADAGAGGGPKAGRRVRRRAAAKAAARKARWRRTARPAGPWLCPTTLPASSINGSNIAQLEGQVRVSSVKSVSDFVEKHPDESVSILRSWLHEA